MSDHQFMTLIFAQQDVFTDTEEKHPVFALVDGATCYTFLLFLLTKLLPDLYKAERKNRVVQQNDTKYM